ncbi:hypothetical protein JOM56_009270 [Amanita muscaria]
MDPPAPELAHELASTSKYQARKNLEDNQSNISMKGCPPTRFEMGSSLCGHKILSFTFANSYYYLRATSDLIFPLSRHKELEFVIADHASDPPFEIYNTFREKNDVNHDPCSVCGLVVRYKCDIAWHQRQHAEKKEELMTRCSWPDCEYKSLQRSNVTVHARKQHNWEIHHCRPTCKFSAVLKKDLAQHQQEVHRTKCTTTEWEVEGPIDPDRAPRKPCNKKQTLDALPSSVSEERAAPLSAVSSSSLKERHPHIPTFPCTIRYLEPSSDNTRDAAYMSGGPQYVLDTSKAWLLWNQG